MDNDSDNNNSVLYRYSCRRCPIRNRCIEESDNSPITKAALRNSFQNKTDTLELWASLQTNCLLIKTEQQMKLAGKESLLSQRLRSIREAKGQSDIADIINNNEEVSSRAPAPRLAPLSGRKPSLLNRVQESPPPPQPQQEIEFKSPAPAPKPVSSPAPHPAEPTWLTIRSSGRHIALPTNGELVLGRFDPNFGIPPDVDLTFEDSGQNAVSRRHARIEGKKGAHTIQEMGSGSGIQVNGKPLQLGEVYSLRVGDIITLGRCELMYDYFPRRLIAPRAMDIKEHLLMFASTGEKIQVRDGSEMVIGRSDKHVNFTPDIDLAKLAQIANKVSRRHARLFFRLGSPHLHIEDMGSGFGTKVNGNLIMLGDSSPLHPGDHIWLGGCVLAYDLIVW